MFVHVYFISSEVFHIVRIEGLKVKIKGHHCDGIPDMILSVKEDEDGKPEPPRFRTKEESEPVGCEAGMLIMNFTT